MDSILIGNQDPEDLNLKAAYCLKGTPLKKKVEIQAKSQVWWHTTVMAVFTKWKQEDREFKDVIGHMRQWAKQEKKMVNT